MITTSLPLTSETLTVDSLLPPERADFTVRETAEILGCSDQYIRDCFDQGKLMGQRANGRILSGHERRRRLRISRESILLYLAENATGDPETVVRRVEALIVSLPDRSRRSLMARLTPGASLSG